MKRLAAALLVLVVAASIATSVVAGSIASTATTATTDTTVGQASGAAYAGTHVSFDAEGSAVTDYAVRGETMLDSVKVESRESVESGGLRDLGTSLSAVTEIEGAGLSLGATTTTETRVRAESGATLTAHDNDRGVLVVARGNQSDQSNYVVADLSAGANVSADGDSQVEVTTENGTEGTVLVAGEGNATVNDDGDVTARLGADGQLIFRAYPDGKDAGDDEQERLIAEETAAAETYVMTEGNETVVDTVSYGENTTVESVETAEGEVSFAVNRTTHEGTVLLTSVSERALDATGDLEVAVDGETAAEARTYTQLESAIGSEQSRYVVESAASGSADASADVSVAVNHFSERTVSMRSADSVSETTSEGEQTTDETTADDGATTEESPTTGDSEETPTTMVVDDETDNGASIPGFTASAAVLALVSAVLLARLR
ncbi:PGF-CTERM sorting domain-containing protein [Halorussus pelagicus]|uniref:PGF-CTERM sorting domain-containing protein n=1 Tax=Halorussus pelagicus TaxID=2505977 RepID=UPI00140C2B7C|nr:PGF-CTERM sorting domain-containing protein [Halorussus pelagicus]